MLDNQLIDFLVTQLNTAIQSAGWSFDVVQKNNPTIQGIPSTPTVFFEKLFDHNYGFQHVDLTLSQDQTQYLSTTSQAVETSFQISAWAIQDPANVTLPTASDIAHQCCRYLQHPVVVQNFAAAGIQMLRVTEVRNPYLQDDKSQFEAVPSFDIVLIHGRDLTMSVPMADKIVQQGIYNQDDLPTGIIGE